MMAAGRQWSAGPTLLDIEEAYREDWRFDERRRLRFADAWRDIGRPFFRCVYCKAESKADAIYHFTAIDPKTGKPTPGVPVCTSEKFVRGVVAQFHSLRRSPGLAPWDPFVFARYQRGPARTGGSYHAAAFVLSVWSGGNRDSDGKQWFRGYDFDAVKAMGSWDYEHREAFLRWCQNPWWP